MVGKFKNDLVEKVLIALSILSAIALSILSVFEVSGRIILVGFVFIPFIVLLFLYVIQIKFSVYTFFLLLLLTEILGLVFKIQHFPGAGPMMIVGLFVNFLLALFFIWSAVKMKDKLNPIYFYIIAAILILKNSVILIPIMENFDDNYVLIYMLVAVIGTIKLQKLKVNPGIDKILNIILIHEILIVIFTTSFLFKS
ncbi:MAG: hypothetical protein K9J13_06845 [Saprospiraceae bacterium]|nr:hypothetical protein [Saprospiraceae bacterium]